MASRSFSVIAKPHGYSTLRPRTLPCSVSQSNSPWDAAIERIKQLAAVSPGDLRDRLGENLDVVSSRVRSCVPSPQLGREELSGVVAPHPDPGGTRKSA